VDFDAEARAKRLRRLWIRYVGGGLGPGVEEPTQYIDAVSDLTKRMAARTDWKAWWAPMQPLQLWVDLYFEGLDPDGLFPGENGVTSLFGKTGHRRRKEEVSAALVFAPSEHAGLTADDGRAHVEALMLRLAKTYKLGAPPALPR
jgi:hypothetical protein